MFQQQEPDQVLTTQPSSMAAHNPGNWADFQPESLFPLYLQKLRPDHAAHSAARNQVFLWEQRGHPTASLHPLPTHIAELQGPEVGVGDEGGSSVSWVRWRKQVGLQVLGNTLGIPNQLKRGLSLYRERRNKETQKKCGWYLCPPHTPSPTASPGTSAGVSLGPQGPPGTATWLPGDRHTRVGVKQRLARGQAGEIKNIHNDSWPVSLQALWLSGWSSHSDLNFPVHPLQWLWLTLTLIHALWYT